MLGTTGVEELASVITTEMGDEMFLKSDIFNVPATAHQIRELLTHDAFHEQRDSSQVVDDLRNRAFDERRRKWDSRQRAVLRDSGPSEPGHTTLHGRPL
jgi:hypothetical protein